MLSSNPLDEPWPWTTNWLPGMNTGAKKPRPWMWSQWVCDSRIVALPLPLPNSPASRWLPSGISPVPMSMMISSPPLPVTVMHDVLPP